MKSIAFPKMLNTNSTRIVTDKFGEATGQNLRTLILSEPGEFKDDPYFGVKLKRFMFEPNNNIIKDLLIDEIYTKVSLFEPQLIIKRNDIIIEQSGNSVVAKLKVVNKKDFTTSLFNIVLFQK